MKLPPALSVSGAIFRSCRRQLSVHPLLSSLAFLGVATAVGPRADAAAVPGPGESARAGFPAPPFTVRQNSGRWDLINPAGQPFFSLGVCAVNQGSGRDAFDPENPGYAGWQHYATAGAWAEATVRRLKEWHFTTIGAWSDHRVLAKAGGMTLWQTPVLHIGSTAGAPWWDMWDERVIRRMDAVAREQILALRDDPRIIGYYSDNELGWWNATLFKMTLEQAPGSGQRKRLIHLLRETYHDDWNALGRDFDSEHADTWRQLEKSGMLFLKPGGNGIRVMRQFLALLADRYYQLTRDLIRKYDRRALILGDRYQSFYYPEVARAAARYVDVISSNLNASWNDGSYLRCYLDTLHALTGKPILVSEIYMAADQNRSGNRNTMGIYPVVPNQTDRASGLRATLQSLVQTPYVVGVDWFQYSDEPRHGRQDGENYNFGLVDIDDRPYAELCSTFASLDINRPRQGAAPARTDATSGVPRAPADPFTNFVSTLALKQWDREQGFVPASTEFPMADLYICWSPRAIYLGVYAQEIIEDAFYRDHSIPKGDRPVWEIRLGSGPPVRVRLGGGREAIASDPHLRVEHISGLNLNVRNIAAVELPASFLGRDRLRAGDALELHSTLASHCRAYHMAWNGRFVLRETGEKKR